MWGAPSALEPRKEPRPRWGALARAAAPCTDALLLGVADDTPGSEARYPAREVVEPALPRFRTMQAEWWDDPPPPPPADSVWYPNSLYPPEYAPR